MERIQEIIAQVNSMELTYNAMTEEEFEKSKVDSFNSSTGSLHEVDGYTCDVCHNKGWIMRAFQTENGHWSNASRPCKCMKVRSTIRKMQNSGLKDIIKDYTFAKYTASDEWQQKIKSAAMAYAESPSGWFFIGGQSGSGKTHICTAICRTFLLAGRDVLYMMWRDDVAKIKNFTNDAEQREKLINQYKKVSVLYIDDLFKTGKGSDGVKQRPTVGDINVAFEILNYRYNNPSLLTIISSECTIDDILDIDEATGGRIFERAKTAFSMKPDKRKNYRLKGVVEL